jgi:hypothetical protein
VGLEPFRLRPPAAHLASGVTQKTDGIFTSVTVPDHQGPPLSAVIEETAVHPFTHEFHQLHNTAVSNYAPNNRPAISDLFDLFNF